VIYSENDSSQNSSTLNDDSSTSSFQVQKELLNHIGERFAVKDWRVKMLSGGIESSVFSIQSSCGPRLLLKFSEYRYTNNDNDPDLDFLRLYEQERDLSLLAFANGVPIARPFDVFLFGEEVPVALMEFVEHDGSRPSSVGLGRLARTVHNIKCAGAKTVAMRGREIVDIVSNLIIRRLEVVRAIAGGGVGIIDRDWLVRLLRPLEDDARLLHLDLRAENILCREGNPIALIDWNNAMVAHPLLEIARIYEYGDLTKEFCVGYGDVDLMSVVNTRFGKVCRLYTAAMMCVLYLSEIPNVSEAADRLARLQVLLNSLREEK